MGSLDALVEKIQVIYSKYVDRENLKPLFDKRLARQYVRDVINNILSVRINEDLRAGLSNLPVGVIATYTSIAVTSSYGVSTITLPAQPIAGLGDIGVYEIFSDEMDPYIPLPGQLAKIMSGTDLEAALDLQTGWFRNGSKTVRFTKDIGSAPYSVTDVTVRLVIHDLSTYTASSDLPIPPEYELDVIKGVLQLMGLGNVALPELNAEENAD